MLDFLIRGGYVMIPILACSVVSLAVIIERGFSLRTGRVLPPELMDRLEAMERGKDSSWQAGRNGRSILGKILNLGYANRGLSRQENHEIFQVAIKQVESRLERGLFLLEIVAVISPLLGLLGTVIGMVQVFNVISRIGAGHAQELSAGISQALITTIAGLVVAIPALVAHGIYTRKIDNLILGIEEAATRLLQKLYP